MQTSIKNTHEKQSVHKRMWMMTSTITLSCAAITAQEPTASSTCQVV